MDQNTFLKKLTELAEEFEISNDNAIIQLFFVSPTEEVFRWDGSAFKSKGNDVKVRVRKKPLSTRENTSGLSPKKRLELIERDLSIVSYFLSKYKYLNKKTKERVDKFLPFFKEEYLNEIMGAFQ